jgi:colanic acid/amylovoran biosynthesis glycosyltransferase
MPIIGARHCDIPEVTQNGVTGLLAEEKNVEGLLIHLEALIANPKGWEPMLRASRQHIELEYDAMQAERLARMYKKLECQWFDGRVWRW